MPDATDPSTPLDFWAVGPNNDPDDPGFPEARVCMAVHTMNLSRRASMSIASGAAVSLYPVSNLTDGSGCTVGKINRNYGCFQADCGAAVQPDVLAVINHNFADGVLCAIEASNDPAFGTTVLTGWGMLSRRPVMWLDLRTILTAAARYWRVWVLTTNPSVADLAVGELVLAQVAEFDGTITSLRELERGFVARQYTEEGLPYKMMAGAVQRAVSIELELFQVLRETFQEIVGEAGASGERVLYIPNSRQPEAYFLDWPAALELAYAQSALVATGSVDAPEESFGAI